MPLWIAMKLLPLQLALGLGAELLTTMRTQTVLLQQPDQPLALTTVMADAARVHIDLIQQVAQRF